MTTSDPRIVSRTVSDSWVIYKRLIYLSEKQIFVSNENLVFIYVIVLSIFTMSHKEYTDDGV